MKIFSFWKSRERRPGCIRLFLRTRRRYLSEGEVFVLEASSIDWLASQSVIGGAIVQCKMMTLLRQADVNHVNAVKAKRLPCAVRDLASGL